MATKKKLSEAKKRVVLAKIELSRAQAELRREERRQRKAMWNIVLVVVVLAWFAYLFITVVR